VSRRVETERVGIEIAIIGRAGRESARAERVENGGGWRVRCERRGLWRRGMRSEDTGKIEE
jgi:hypothetical protein